MNVGKDTVVNAIKGDKNSFADLYYCCYKDFYNFALIDDDHLAMWIGDVSDKGVPAALFMMAAKIILANYAMMGKSPSEVLEATNLTVCSNNPREMFVTVWLGILEISTGILTAANAGHEYPALKKNGRFEIKVTEIPYNVNKARLVESIADLVKDKRIEGISDLRDESDKKGLRIVIELKRDVNANIVLNYLYKHTQLQETFGAIMLALVDGEPKVLTLREMLYHYLQHQKEIVTRRTRYDLDKAEARAHILEGLLKRAAGNYRYAVAMQSLFRYPSLTYENHYIPYYLKQFIDDYQGVGGDVDKLMKSPEMAGITLEQLDTYRNQLSSSSSEEMTEEQQALQILSELASQAADINRYAAMSAEEYANLSDIEREADSLFYLSLQFCGLDQEILSQYEEFKDFDFARAKRLSDEYIRNNPEVAEELQSMM